MTGPSFSPSHAWSHSSHYVVSRASRRERERQTDCCFAICYLKPDARTTAYQARRACCGSYESPSHSCGQARLCRAAAWMPRDRVLEVGAILSTRSSTCLKDAKTENSGPCDQVTSLVGMPTKDFTDLLGKVRFSIGFVEKRDAGLELSLVDHGILGV